MKLYSSNCLLIILFQGELSVRLYVLFFIHYLTKCNVAALCEFFNKLY
jgi:hypothetical protein